MILTTEYFRLEIESGDGQFSESKDNYEEAQRKVKELLLSIGAKSEDEAKSLGSEYSLAFKAREFAQNALDSILNGQTLEELESIVGDDTPVPKRDIEQVNGAILANRATHNNTKTSLESNHNAVKDWQETYETQDKVLDHLVDARNLTTQLEKEREQLPPVPEGIDDQESLESELSAKESRLRDIKEKHLYDAKSKQATLTATEPERTTQELRAIIEEADARCALEKRRLNSLYRVKEVFQQKRESLDSGTLNPWTQRLSQTIQHVTSDRYEDLDLNEGEVTRSSGLVLPHSLLSMGTKASMGFSLRLSMAAFFLENLDGFLILDDPMVDLDEGRQQQTAELLREFAEHKQVILLTCHQSHAELLTDTPIQIDCDDIVGMT